MSYGVTKKTATGGVYAPGSRNFDSSPTLKDLSNYLNGSGATSSVNGERVTGKFGNSIRFSVHFSPIISDETGRAEIHYSLTLTENSKRTRRVSDELVDKITAYIGPFAREEVVGRKKS